jgi:hypothetical protein
LLDRHLWFILVDDLDLGLDLASDLGLDLGFMFLGIFM